MCECSNFRFPLGIILILGLIAAPQPANAQVKQGGEHIPAKIDTPRDYKGLGGEEPVTIWFYELYHPDATYIAVHFVDFDLGPGDYLIVSDRNGLQSYTMEGRGKMNAGTFWAQHIKGDTALLELVQVSREGGCGFIIDEYVAGFMDMGLPPDPRAICGADDKENAKCYETSHPTEYQRGRAICRLLSNGSGFCTGWLASSQNHVITNEHCVGSASSALNTDFDFGAEAPTCATPNCPDCFPGTIYSGAVFIQANANYDYCLMQITTGDPAPTFGYLDIDDRVAVPGEEIYIIGHPGGRAKEFSIYSTDPHDPSGIPIVDSITAPPCTGSGYFDVGYYADTEGGSSGSAVLARSSHKVIALHHCANCPNRGVPIHLVYDEVGQYLTPGPAGTVELDKGLYGCSDSVGIELRDGDLLGTVSHNVLVTTSGGDSETVTLLETGADTAVFQGNILTGTGSVVTEDGTLQVAPGQTITVTYIDEDDGQGGVNVVVTDTADVDCTPPVITNVQTTDVQGRNATITITANEPIRGTVHYGTSCGSLTHSTTGTGFANPATVNLTGLDENTTYFYAVDVEDEAGNTATDDNGGACYTFATPDIPNYFTEQFSGDSDTEGLSLIFTPDGSADYYDGCTEDITDLPTDPAGGSTISLSDDDYELISLTGETVAIYGAAYSSFYVGSNGYITFGSGDTDYSESLSDHFDLPRISGWFDDLNPSTGGTVSWKQLADRVAVTWENVPEYSATGSNTFQVEMFFDGMIRLSYTSLDSTDSIVGLSAGGGTPGDFYETDLSLMPVCSLCGSVEHTKGYIDGDSKINGFDVQAFVAVWMDPGSASPREWCASDIDSNEQIDMDDVAAFVDLLLEG